jgi:hypothetical protein
LNTNIYSDLETSSGQTSNLCFNVAHFFNTSVNWISVAAKDSCFPALVSNMGFSIGKNALSGHPGHPGFILDLFYSVSNFKKFPNSKCS